jgi:hypothetical protein
MPDILHLFRKSEVSSEGSYAEGEGQLCGKKIEAKPDFFPFYFSITRFYPVNIFP